MIIKCTDFYKFADFIKSDEKKIIMFGAGAIGTVTTPEILKLFGISKYIDCYIDNNSALWGSKINLKSGEYYVKSPDYLKSCIPEKTVILVNISRFTSVIDQIESMVCTEKMPVYFMAMMCIHNFIPNGKSGVIKKYEYPVIPKIIHYMWLGGKEVPQNLLKCIDSWKRYCPDYEIKRWDESNYDIGKNLYMKQAYECRAYGFVPDYARLDILYNYGGIYLDTDVELIRNIDDLLYQEAFCGVEKWQIVNFGGCSGAVKGHDSIKAFINARENLKFYDEYGLKNQNTCGYYDTQVLLNNGYIMNCTNQSVLGINVYTSDFFHPYDYMSGKCEITSNTFSVHHFNGGWLTKEQKQLNKSLSGKYFQYYKQALINGKIN